MVETCDRRTGACAHGTVDSISAPQATANAAITGDGPQRRRSSSPGAASVSSRVTAPLSHSTPLTRLASASSPGLSSRSRPHDDISAAQLTCTETSSACPCARSPRDSDHQRCSAGHQNVVRPPTVARASSAPQRGQMAAAPARGDELAGVRAAAADRRAHRGAHVAAQAVELVGAQLAGRAARGEARAPEDLVGQQVADAGDDGLVHEPRLERRGPAADARAEARRA